MDTMFWVWLAVIAVALLIEIVTLDLVSIWFSFGALIPFILAAVGGIAIEIQIAIFVVVSALLIIFIRKYAQKLLFKNMDAKTNVDSLIGKKFKMLETTDFEKNGSLKINDVIWTAVGENSEQIKQGAIVEVVKVDGNKLIVKEVKEDNKLTTSNEEKKVASKEEAKQEDYTDTNINNDDNVSDVEKKENNEIKEERSLEVKDENKDEED